MNKLLLLTILSSFFFSTTFAQTVSYKEERVTELTQTEFIKKVIDYKKNPTDWIYLGEKPCIIDFYATWCGPCKRIAPILEQLSEEYKDEIVIYKIDIDKEKELAQVFNIKSVPSIIFSPLQGKPTLVSGGIPKENFIKIINKQLLNK